MPITEFLRCRGPHPHRGRGLPRAGRAPLAGLRRPPPARALLGPGGVARHLHPPRHGGGGRVPLLHDRTRRDLARGWFRFLAIEPLRRALEVEDGFATTGRPNPTCPRCAWSSPSRRPPPGRASPGSPASPASRRMEQLVGMGMDGGDALGHGAARRGAGRPRLLRGESRTEAQLLNDTQVRISRIIRGTVEAVWRAHHEPGAHEALAPGPRRLDDAGVRGGERGGGIVPLRVGGGGRLGPLRLRGGDPRVRAAPPGGHQRADDRNGWTGDAKRDDPRARARGDPPDPGHHLRPSPPGWSKGWSSATGAWRRRCSRGRQPEGSPASPSG
jgi:hypothetical protein